MDFLKEILNVILPDGLSLADFIGYYIIGLLGIATSIFHEVFRKRETIKTSGSSFSWKKLWNDNKLRICLSLLVVAVGILIGEEFGFIVGKGLAFLAGFGTDKFIETLSPDNLRKT